MQVVVQRAAALDLHKDVIAAKVHTPETEDLQKFGTTTREIERLAKWLLEHKVAHVAMESTGVYWKPVYNILEEHPFELTLVNARIHKNPNTDKTDFKDAIWLCDLLRHGLLRSSFVPDREQRERRELCTYRRSLVRERASEVTRVQKVLEGANIKLGSVATDVLGVSGRLMLTAMVEGVTDPEVLADMARGRLRAKKGALEEALYGKMGPHQRQMLELMLGHIDDLDARIERISKELDERLRPFAKQIELLDGVYGIAKDSAQVAIAVLGTDMSRFPSADHCASWVGLSPANNLSAGKRIKGKHKKNRGNDLLHQTLIECAQAIGKNRGSYLCAQYRRIAARSGKNVAAVAVAHSLVVIIYHILKTGEPYRDLGQDYFDKRDQTKTVHRLTKRLENLGYEVTLKAAA